MSEPAASPLAPGFLIAVPELMDPNFARTVVLLLEHGGENGAFGVVLNRPMKLGLPRVAEAVGVSWGGALPAPRACWGGPVQKESAWLLHDGSRVLGESVSVAPGLSFTLSLDAMKSILTEPAGEFRLFLGYAGWSPGQLEDEIRAGGWINAPVEPGLVFSESADHLWEEALALVGIDPSRYGQGGGLH